MWTLLSSEPQPQTTTTDTDALASDEYGLFTIGLEQQALVDMQKSLILHTLSLADADEPLHALLEPNRRVADTEYKTGISEMLVCLSRDRLACANSSLFLRGAPSRPVQHGSNLS